MGHLEWVGKRYVSLRIFLKKREVQDSDKSMQTDETEVGDLVGWDLCFMTYRSYWDVDQVILECYLGHISI